MCVYVCVGVCACVYVRVNMVKHNYACRLFRIIIILYCIFNSYIKRLILFKALHKIYEILWSAFSRKLETLNPARVDDAMTEEVAKGQSTTLYYCRWDLETRQRILHMETRQRILHMRDACIMYACMYSCIFICTYTHCICNYIYTCKKWCCLYLHMCVSIYCIHEMPECVRVIIS